MVGWLIGRLVGGWVSVDCIDCCAEVAVVEAVTCGVRAATSLADTLGVGELRQPWVMVSVNVGEDPHFRKASETIPLPFMFLMKLLWR